MNSKQIPRGFNLKVLAAVIAASTTFASSAQTGGGTKLSGGPIEDGPITASNLKLPTGHLPYSIGVWRTGVPSNTASFCVKVGALKVGNIALGSMNPRFGYYESTEAHGQCGASMRIGAVQSGVNAKNSKQPYPPGYPKCWKVSWKPIPMFFMPSPSIQADLSSSPKTVSRVNANEPTSTATYCSSAGIFSRPNFLVGMHPSTDGSFDYYGLPINFVSDPSTAPDLAVEVNGLALLPPLMPLTVSTGGIGVSAPKLYLKN
jgi:hypothetical protein